MLFLWQIWQYSMLCFSVITTLKIYSFAAFFQIGSVAANYISGLILTHYTWPIVFYFWGALSIVWFIVFVSFFFLLRIEIKNCTKLVNRKKFMFFRQYFVTVIPILIHSFHKRSVNICRLKSVD